MMATPPEHPEHDGSPLRCSMCGKENPAGASHCELCGSALKPVDSPGQPEGPPPGENEPTLDLLAQLRAEIEADSEATVIHKPGSGKSVADLINEIEPDFVFGSSQEPEASQADEGPSQPETPSGSIPDWLTEITDSDSADTGGDLSDWLADNAPTPSDDQVPDWLKESLPLQPAFPDSGGEEASAEPEPAPPVESGVPDWLAESIETPGDLEEQEAAKPAPQIPSPPAEEAVPDWLSESLDEAPAPPAASPVSPGLPDDEMPDWLAEGLSDTPLGPPPVTADVPDWLPAAGGAAPVKGSVPDWIPESSPSQPAVGKTPDWLPAAEAPSVPSRPPAPPAGLPPAMSGAAREPQPTPSAETEDTPDWLKAGDDEDLPDWMQAASPAPPKAEPAAGSGDIPDWLGGPADEGVSEAPPMGEPEPTAEPASPEQDLPDWLAQAAPGEEISEAPPMGEPEPTAEPASSEQDLPDWLAQAAPGEEISEAPPVGEPEPTAEPTPSEQELPDWLTQAAPETAGPSPVELEEPPVPPDVSVPPPTPEPVDAGAGDLPDWLVGASSEAPEEAEVPQPAAPSDAAANLPDWLMAAGEKKADLPDQPQPAEPELLEDEEWLGLLDQDKPPAQPAAAPSPRPAEAGDDLLGFMDTLGLGDSVPPVAQDVPDILGSGSQEVPGGIPGDEDEIVGDLSALPGWEQDDAALPDDIEVVPELLDQIGDLRFESITGRQPQETEHDPELVGALKDVTGVIQPELIFEGETLRVGERLDTLVTSNSQAKQVVLIEELLAREAFGERAIEREAELPLVRWITTLILLVAIAIPSLTGMSISPPTKVPQSIVAARQHISSLPPNANVLVAFEYEPDTAAEMEPLALAILNDLANRPDITVYAISTRPTGPAMAHRALQSTPNLNGVNLGYITGGRNGISALTIGSISGIPSPLATDYAGNPTGITSSSLIGMQPPVNLILVVTARQEYLQAWVEQAGAPTGIPIIAATSAGSAPMAYPYQQSGQLVAVISGINEAAAYPGGTGQAITLDILSAQAFGAVVAVIAIIVGTLLLGLRAIREQQEQVG